MTSGGYRDDIEPEDKADVPISPPMETADTPIGFFASQLME